tara:strand:- start:465 stop:671 length:207 start_codon:yes stop_codon:yes gene_type:complete
MLFFQKQVGHRFTGPQCAVSDVGGLYASTRDMATVLELLQVYAGRIKKVIVAVDVHHLFVGAIHCLME